MSNATKKNRLVLRLNDLKEAVNARLVVESEGAVHKAEIEAVREERDIDLIEAMDCVSRLIDIEHEYYEE